jgi:uncharacterized protein YceK
MTNGSVILVLLVVLSGCGRMETRQEEGYELYIDLYAEECRASASAKRGTTDESDRKTIEGPPL